MSSPTGGKADSGPSTPVLELPYAARQQVIALEEHSVEELSHFISGPPYKPSIGKRLWDEIKIAKPADWSINPFKKTPEEKRFAALSPEARAVVVLHMSKGTAIRPLRPAEVDVLDLPPGHPRDGVVYVGNPAEARLYYPTGEFHRRTFEHKFSEAIRLLMSLGATHISVRAEKGWGREVNLQVDVPSPLRKAKGKIKANRGERSDLLFEAELDGNSPRLPQRLSWFHGESTWQEIAEGRLHHGLRKFSLDVNYNDDYGIDADLSGRINAAGLKIGGQFVKAMQTTWRLEGRFG